MSNSYEIKNHLNRRDFLKTTAAATVVSALTPFLNSCGEAKKPNILFIMVDDLGKEWVSCYGSDDVQTPHIDALAKNGMLFTNAYAASPLCSPTRASIMTGKYPARLGITTPPATCRRWTPRSRSSPIRPRPTGR